MRSAFTCLLAVAGAAASGALIAPAQARAAGPGPLYQQSFAGDSVPGSDWLSGGSACLTAGTAGTTSGIGACRANTDPAGKGVLRLTGNGKGEAGYALYTQPVEADRGLDISFDMYQYNASTKPGADGIGFILVDGGASPGKVGSAGGDLGYKGLAGGYLGIGFDYFGNFASKALWGNGVDGKAPNSVVVRGARSAGYPLISREAASHQLSDDGAKSRGSATHHVVIRLSTSGILTVQVSYGGQLVTEIKNLDLDATPGQPSLPATVKFALTASTGSNTDVHEVSGLVISALPPDLHMAIKADGTVQAGATATWVSTVSNDRNAGPTTGPVTATETFPPGVTPQTAAGDGWSCTISGQQVTCTRPDVLAPEKDFPPIRVTTSVTTDVPARITVSGTAATAGQDKPADGNADVTVPVAGPPDLSIALTPLGQFLAPGFGTYMVTVSDATNAGPTIGPATVTFPVPAGQTPVSANGRDWSCTLSGQQVTCVNKTALGPGKTYPEIAVTVQTGALSVSPAAQVSTPGNAGGQAVTSQPVSVGLVAAAPAPSSASTAP